MIPFLFLALALPITDQSLNQAIENRDTGKTIIRIREMVKEHGVRAVPVIADAIAAVEAVPEAQWFVTDRHRVFVASIKAVSLIKEAGLAKEVDRIVKTHKHWPSRVFALELSLQSSSIDSIQLSLAALHDKAPQVVAVGARILGWSQKIIVLEPLISAMARWEQQSTRDKVVRGGREELQKQSGDRAWLACRDSLERLTGISLHGATQYKNWISAHRDEIDPSKVDLSKPKIETTGTGLFGLEITGKNIVFLFDVSGSMLATDPPTTEQMERLRRSTGVADSIEDKIQQLMEGRRRIKRARRELSKAIKSLGDDKNFSLIAFSSTVQPWSDILLPATRENRESASNFALAMQAQGITITDLALLKALSDPTVDTIYLMTDGAPTHIGSQGQQMPPDSPELMKRIIEDTRARNHLRGVRIFTLGFIGAEEEFLDKLATDNHGRYVRIR